MKKIINKLIPVALTTLAGSASFAISTSCSKPDNKHNITVEAFDYEDWEIEYDDVKLDIAQCKHQENLIVNVSSTETTIVDIRQIKINNEKINDFESIFSEDYKSVKLIIPAEYIVGDIKIQVYGTRQAMLIVQPKNREISGEYVGLRYGSPAFKYEIGTFRAFGYNVRGLHFDYRWDDSLVDEPDVAFDMFYKNSHEVKLTLYATERNMHFASINKIYFTISAEIPEHFLPVDVITDSEFFLNFAEQEHFEDNANVVTTKPYWQVNVPQFAYLHPKSKDDIPTVEVFDEKGVKRTDITATFKPYLFLSCPSPDSILTDYKTVLYLVVTNQGQQSGRYRINVFDKPDFGNPLPDTDWKLTRDPDDRYKYTIQNTVDIGWSNAWKERRSDDVLWMEPLKYYPYISVTNTGNRFKFKITSFDFPGVYATIGIETENWIPSSGNVEIHLGMFVKEAPMDEMYYDFSGQIV